jgi:2-dehydro-3-deoxyphosphooctonate aldolase (KDO 8-P synthase)
MILIAGPCVIDKQTLKIADLVAAVFERYNTHFECYFKASYDKANRTSHTSYRGPGLTEGLKVLKEIKKSTGMPVITDVHREQDVAQVADAVDMIQVPALLSRQTDLVMAVGASGRRVNIKKGQFASPWDMSHAVDKLKAAGCNQDIYVTERGTSFGYQRLIVDICSVPILQRMGMNVLLDCTHSLQLPAAGTGCSASQPREFAKTLALAATAAGADGLFFEVYPNPDEALCDGQNSISLTQLTDILDNVLAIRQAVNHRHHRTDE